MELEKTISLEIVNRSHFKKDRMSDPRYGIVRWLLLCLLFHTVVIQSLRLALAAELKSTSAVHTAAAQSTKNSSNSTLQNSAPENAINVNAIKEKYWARGEESELGVVQNRIYSKERKWEIGVFQGVVSSDPFLSIRKTGGSFGFHFSEYASLQLLGWKDFVSSSSALKTFEETIGATTNNNPPRYFLGTEGIASILYGKLSLIGWAIIYYDMHLLGGAGVTQTESGGYFTPHLGIGQQIFLNRALSLRVDYRLQRYDEKIIEKVITPKLGQVVGERTNWTNTISLGVHFFFGGGTGQ